jgi:hypothetical protein
MTAHKVQKCLPPKWRSLRAIVQVVCYNHNPFLSSFITSHHICYKSNTKGATKWNRNCLPFRSTQQEFINILHAFSYIVTVSFIGGGNRSNGENHHLPQDTDKLDYIMFKSFVVITILSFPHSLLLTRFVTRVTQRVPQSGAGTAYPSVAPNKSSSTFYMLVPVAQSFIPSRRSRVKSE